MTLNAVIRCSSCNRISKKSGSKDNKCSQCLEIEKLKSNAVRVGENNKALFYKKEEEIGRLNKELKKKFFSDEPPDLYCDNCLNAPECSNKCAECKYTRPSKFQSIDSHTQEAEGYYP